MMRSIFSILLILTSALSSDVKSTTGLIKFDAQSDNQTEMTLNSTGLGIGIAPSTNLHVNGNAIVTGQVFIGGSSGSANLNLNGTFGHSVQSVSSNTTLGNHSIVLVDSSSDNITITLPYAGNVTGRQYQIKKISTSNSVWISGGGNVIDDTSPIELPESSELASVKVISDGIQWYKLDQKNVSETIAEDNLIGWWKLDEQSGFTFLDSSGQNIEGALQNSSSTNVGITGKVNRGVYFDGSDDYIQLGSGKPSDYQFSNQPFTISAWAKTDFSGFFGRIIGADAGGGIYHGYYLRQSGASWGFTISDGGALETTASGTANVWQHVVGVYNVDSQFLYIDGILADSDSNPNVTPNWTSPSEISIGRRGTTNYFDGIIDDVRFYNKALTPAEVQALYNQGL